MKLYHASKQRFDRIERRPAQSPDGYVVPDAELQDKIYLTPDPGFALAMAAGPSGITRVENGQISFEHASDFDATRTVYVYEVEAATIPAEALERVDEAQYAVDVPELIPSAVTEHEASEVFQYYEWVPWQPATEAVREMKPR